MSGEADSRALRELAAGARAARVFALDTEFMGEGRYRTLLCLIQLAIPEAGAMGERIELVDPLAENLDGAPLAEILGDPRIRTVVHAGRQDIALVRRRFGAQVQGVFDTQVAAGFAGFSAQASYEALLSELLGVRVSKSASFTRWDARPLTAEQRSYAREDVVHLLELAAELERRLQALGRLEWALEECAALESSSDERDLDAVFERLPRVRSLSATARPIARELVAWREALAQRDDRPVQSVLGDAALMEIARRAPSSREELQRIRGASSGSIRRRAGELLDAVHRGRARPPEPAPRLPRAQPPRPDDAPLIALCEALVRARARDAGIAYELIAARAELQAIVTARRLRSSEPGVRTLRGWRRELVGEELLELLAGRVSLSVDGGGVRAQAREGLI
jgi:ribonuclease D